MRAYARARTRLHSHSLRVPTCPDTCQCVCVEAPLRLRASALIAYLIDLQRLAYLIDLQQEEGMSASSFK